MTTRNKKDQYYRASIERKDRVAENRCLIIDTVRAALANRYPHAVLSKISNGKHAITIEVSGIEEGEESDALNAVENKLTGRGFAWVSSDGICGFRLIAV